MKKITAVILLVIMVMSAAFGIYSASDSGDSAQNVTRAEFCGLLYDMVERVGGMIPDGLPTDTPFTDTADGSVVALYSLGIVRGTTDTEFSPDLPITREEAAVLFYRTAVMLGLYIPELADDYPYSDSDDISVWALDPIRLMYSFELIQSGDDYKFLPKQNLIKEQAMDAVEKLYAHTIGQGIGGSDGQSFTAELMNAMDKSKNYCLSPFSIRTALAMAANGAVGATKEQILDAVGISSLDEYNNMVRGLIKTYSEGGSIRFDIADSLWLNIDNSDTAVFKDSFKTLIEKYFSGICETVTNDNAVKNINSWVADNTNNKIKGIIDSPDFAAALINAIYFKGTWQNEFEKGATKNDVFTDADGKESTIAFMNQQDKFKLSDDGVTRIIELPYTTLYNTDGKDEYDNIASDGDKDVSMYIIMTGVDNPDPELLINKAEFKSRTVQLKLPKFKIESAMSLKDILAQSGMVAAFDKESADFTNMFDGGNMYITNVLHKTYIDVDETGTEAAAVTAVMMKLTAIWEPEEVVQFYADRPFIYVIRENTAEEILFVGEYRYTK